MHLNAGGRCTGGRLIGLVPDGVATVQIQYEPHVGFTATVRNNVFQHAIPNRFSVGSGDPPERETWRDHRGEVLKTISSTSDGTIVITQPGHRRIVVAMSLSWP